MCCVIVSPVVSYMDKLLALQHKKHDQQQRPEVSQAASPAARDLALEPRRLLTVPESRPNIVAFRQCAAARLAAFMPSFDTEKARNLSTAQGRA